jgi:hypothetical protein
MLAAAFVVCGVWCVVGELGMLAAAARERGGAERMMHAVLKAAATSTFCHTTCKRP